MKALLVNGSMTITFCGECCLTHAVEDIAIDGARQVFEYRLTVCIRGLSLLDVLIDQESPFVP